MYGSIVLINMESPPSSRSRREASVSQRVLSHTSADLCLGLYQVREHQRDYVILSL